MYNLGTAPNVQNLPGGAADTDGRAPRDRRVALRTRAERHAGSVRHAAMSDDGRSSGAAVGIDLGTSNCRVAVWSEERQSVDIITNDHGRPATATVVAFTDRGRLLGDVAKSQAARNPRNTIFDVLRLLGRREGDLTAREQSKLWPFAVCQDAPLDAAHHRLAVARLLHPRLAERALVDAGDTDVVRSIAVCAAMLRTGSSGTGCSEIHIWSNPKGRRGQAFAVEQLLAMSLSERRAAAEAHLGTDVTGAVIATSAALSLLQRRALCDACAIAGLNVLRLVPAVSCSTTPAFLRTRGRERYYCVIDVGGGTCDVCLTTWEDGIQETLAVATCHRGGTDFDARLMHHLLTEFYRMHGLDASEDARAVSRLRKECETAKHTLSSGLQAAVELESFFNGVDFFVRISRARFEELNMDLFRRLLDPVERVLRDSHVSKARVHDVFLTGGSSNIPKVRSIVGEFFEGKHLRRFDDESAATGAAIFAGEFSGRGGGATEDLLLLDVIPMTLGVETSGGVFTEVVARNTTIPNKSIATFTVASDHPDCTEIVLCSGAGGAEGGSAIPTQLTRVEGELEFTAAAQIQAHIRGFLSRRHTGQSCMRIQFYEGEQNMTKGNIKLGEIVFDIPAARRIQRNSVAVVRLTFDVCANNRLEVEALELRSGARQLWTFGDSDESPPTPRAARAHATNHGHPRDRRQYLSWTEVRRMQIEEQGFVAEDIALREALSARNKLEECLYTVRSNLSELETARPDVRIEANDTGRTIFFEAGSNSHARTDYIAVEQALDRTTEWLWCGHTEASASKDDYDVKRLELEATWMACRAARTG
eukprot:COSAG02_NODE_640_length_19049_cov_44.268738_4_plen_820_part_00